MTPWGIRSKIKSAIGLGSAKKADTSDRVRLSMVLPDGQAHEVSCESGYTLVMASQSLETPIATHCPDGHCGQCVVDVSAATGLKAPTEAESNLLRAKGHPEGTRLACHARVVGSGATIRVRQTWSMDEVKGT